MTKKEKETRAKIDELIRGNSDIYGLNFDFSYNTDGVAKLSVLYNGTLIFQNLSGNTENILGSINAMLAVQPFITSKQTALISEEKVYGFISDLNTKLLEATSKIENARNNQAYQTSIIERNEIIEKLRLVLHIFDN